MIKKITYTWALSLCILSSSVFSAKAESNTEFINDSLKSALSMFANATKKYEKGELTKEQYIKIAMDLNKLSEYSTRVSGEVAPVPVKLEIVKDTYPKIKKDFETMLKSMKEGDVREWGEGKLYKRDYGALYVSNYSGDYVSLLDPAVHGPFDYDKLANLNSSLRKLWTDKYDYKIPVDPNVVYELNSSTISK